MNRELKFRAWDKEDKCMIYGDQEYTDAEVISDALETIMHGGSDEWTERIEIMQYTGLDDKNGKPIFEGDILEHYDREDNRRHYEEIIYDSGCFRFKDNEFAQECLSEYLDIGYEVIGNIYENEEMLKEINA